MNQFDITSTIESAFDASKISIVFANMLQMIQDQQKQIDHSNQLLNLFMHKNGVKMSVVDGAIVLEDTDVKEPPPVVVAPSPPLVVTVPPPIEPVQPLPVVQEIVKQEVVKQEVVIQEVVKEIKPVINNITIEVRETKATPAPVVQTVYAPIEKGPDLLTPRVDLLEQKLRELTEIVENKQDFVQNQILEPLPVKEPSKEEAYLAFTKACEEAQNMETIPEGAEEEEEEPEDLRKKRKQEEIVVAPIETGKRQMNVANLPFLTETRVNRILRRLRVRGHLLLMSKRILEDIRKKYSAETLKGKIDNLERETKEASKRVDTLRDIIRKNNISMRESLPKNFRSLLLDLENLMKAIHEIGGIQELVNRLNDLGKVDLGLLTSEGKEQFKSELAIFIRETIITEYDNALQQKLDERISLVVAKEDLAKMLEIPATAMESNFDENYTKLVRIVEKLVKMQSDSLEKSRKEEMGKVIREIVSNKEDSTKDIERVEATSQKYVDQRLHDTMEKLTATREGDVQKAIELGETVVQIKQKVFNLERMTAALDLRPDEVASRKKERDALRELQQKLSNMSVDKLFKEIKAVKQDLKERPSSQQVNRMIDSIEDSFRNQLGDSTHGLKTLVSQVYKSIQNKVDREDIRGLVVARLTQLEKELASKEEEMLSLASSTRCMSCGQMPRDLFSRGGSRTPVAVNHTSRHQQSHGNSYQQTNPRFQSSIELDGLAAPSAASPEPMVLDDELSIPDSELKQSIPTVVVRNPMPHSGSQYSSIQTEEVYDLLTGQAGLKPIQLQHKPLPRDFANSARQQQQQQQQLSNRVKSAPRVVEPMYRKARMQAHMKEMVKVQAPGLDVYGYHSNNPMYVVSDSNSSRLALDAPYEGNGYFNGASLRQPSGDSSFVVTGMRSVAPGSLASTAPTSSTLANAGSNIMAMSASTSNLKTNSIDSPTENSPRSGKYLPSIGINQSLDEGRSGFQPQISN